ncbi:hypothetical protein [Paracoccus yeei]|uniref:hypothetical protein n=1 Tax=Paracoccus yeei TaxID=147645 RepID=UPI001CD62E4A|nr:hypothetical protein [Paracoccus yeei]
MGLASLGWKLSRKGYKPRGAVAQSNRFLNESNPLNPEKYQDKAGTPGERDTLDVSDSPPPENESPGALAGATGTDIEGFWSLFDNNLTRQAQASRIIEAVLACEPADQVLFLETILDQIRPGWPKSFNIDVMEEAGWWADTATTPERKAYMLACYRRLSWADKQAFQTYITGRKSA